MSNTITSKKSRLAVLAILMVVCVVFCRLFVSEFTWWDDPHTVHQNPLMNPVKLDTFAYYWQNQAANIYIPLTYTAWSLLAVIGRVSAGEHNISLNPWFFHAANVFTHAAGSVFLFLLLRTLLQDIRAALIGAIFYAVHPEQVESVAWVSGLKDVLAGALSMAAMWQYAVSRRGGGRRNYVASLVLFIFAMLSKPSAMTTPMILLVIDYLCAQPDTIRGWLNRGLFVRLLPFVLLAIPIALIARSIQYGFISASPAWARPLIMLDSISFYLSKLFAPYPLCLDYSRNPKNVIASGQIWFTWVLSVFVAGACVALFRRGYRWPLAGFMVFVLAPFHVLGLTTFDYQSYSTVADHYQYVALLGPAMLLGWCATQWKTLVTRACCVVLPVLAGLTLIRTGAWQDDKSLNDAILQTNPLSVIGNMNMAAHYSRWLDNERAVEAIEKVKAFDPKNPIVRASAAAIYLQLDRVELAKQEFEEFIALYQEFYGTDSVNVIPAYMKVVEEFMGIGRLEDAERYFERGETLDPTNAKIKWFKVRLSAAKAAAAKRQSPGSTTTR